jgi:anti-sigma B factor antagonist
MAQTPPDEDAPVSRRPNRTVPVNNNDFAIRAMTIGDVTVGGIAVLVISGALDMLTAPHLTQAIDDRITTQGPRALIVDLTEVDFLATAGISTLVSAHHRLEKVAPLAVVADGPATSRVFKLIGLDSILMVYSTLEVALNSDYVRQSSP